jgi:hypothetical protein
VPPIADFAGDTQPPRQVLGVEHEASIGESRQDVERETCLEITRRSPLGDTADEQLAELHSGCFGAVPVEVYGTEAVPGAESLYVRVGNFVDLGRLELAAADEVTVGFALVCGLTGRHADEVFFSGHGSVP